MPKLLSEAIRDIIQHVENNYNQTKSLTLSPQQMAVEDDKTKTTHWLYVHTGTNYDQFADQLESDLKDDIEHDLQVLEIDSRNHRLKVQLKFPDEEVI
jgi:hypothetical protein